MPRSCTICTHPECAAIEAQILAGRPNRTIAKQWRVSSASVFRHKGHMREAIRRAQVERGLSTVQAVLLRMEETYDRLSELVDKLEAENDHRATIAGFRALRESLMAIYNMLIGADLERRLRELEAGGGGRPPFIVNVVADGPELPKQ